MGASLPSSPSPTFSVTPFPWGQGSFLPTGCERALDPQRTEQQGGDLPRDCLCEPASTPPVALQDRPSASSICLRDKLFNGAGAGSGEDDKF